MIVDTSAVIAMLANEPDAHHHALAVALQPARMSAGNYLEAGGIVADSILDPVVARRLDEVLAESDIEIEPVTRLHATLSRQAYRDFGRGSGHPANLNFGDCFAHALAVDSG
ncbi:type II toxin-antitoxin system VapC family toxin [Tsukamurella pseudospumae]|uniref:PIN domain-containing protein n=1 Tax=Tsukamurella pseudospumae TaxID=239498 RepID=A0A138A438_9ACTN|nr:type II toxin-antitoxin system VapC family toxin [Tsukamurella pseudospumae]KXP05191.1 hypothetical protein AXK60_13655 [Tsukamurella pseudospumae]